MSRPRKPFGSTHPGRLPATMMKVLAAEMSDPSRLRRGKQYAKDGSVLDIEIEPGIVTCEVQGTRSTPYVASIEVTMGDGMPLRRDVTTHCSCPDDDNWDGYSCKHTIAAMFTFSDELLLEPELLDLWRGRSEGATGSPIEPSTRTDDRPARSGDGAAGDRRPSRRHLRLVGPPREADAVIDVDPPGPIVDPLEAQLAFVGGGELPAVPEVERLDPAPPRDPQLAAVLRDAWMHLRIDWD